MENAKTFWRDKNRIFHVFYAFEGGFGSCNIGRDDGRYISKKDALETIKRFSGSETAVITNIVELSDDDYSDWIKG
jgi:hypothetical protein